MNDNRLNELIDNVREVMEDLRGYQDSQENSVPDFKRLLSGTTGDPDLFFHIGHIDRILQYTKLWNNYWLVRVVNKAGVPYSIILEDYFEIYSTPTEFEAGMIYHAVQQDFLNRPNWKEWNE